MKVNKKGEQKMIEGRESEEGVEQRIREDKSHVECKRESEREREN